MDRGEAVTSPASMPPRRCLERRVDLDDAQQAFDHAGAMRATNQAPAAPQAPTPERAASAAPTQALERFLRLPGSWARPSLTAVLRFWIRHRLILPTRQCPSHKRAAANQPSELDAVVTGPRAPNAIGQVSGGFSVQRDQEQRADFDRGHASLARSDALGRAPLEQKRSFWERVHEV